MEEGSKEGRKDDDDFWGDYFIFFIDEFVFRASAMLQTTSSPRYLPYKLRKEMKINNP
jgi:hypothetical protein